MKEVDCSGADLSWSKSLAAVVELGGGLIAANADNLKLVLMDASKKGAPKRIGEADPPHLFSTMKYFEEWPLLALISDDAISLYDVSTPSKPKRTAVFKYDVGHERDLTFMGKDLYVTHENGVALLDPKKRKPKHLFDVPDDEFFKSYPTGLTSHGSHLYVTGYDAGLHVYERKDAAHFELICSVAKGYTPSTLHWWIPGKVLLMVGNEDVIAVDTSTPSKVKWMKSCKVKGFNLSGQLTRLDDERAFVVGAKHGKLAFATIDLKQPLTPKITELIKYSSKTDRFDVAHFARVGSQVIVGGTYLGRLRVFAI